jgi:hypothetical protein
VRATKEPFLDGSGAFVAANAGRERARLAAHRARRRITITRTTTIVSAKFWSVLAHGLLI